jgi:hypothetical protein
VILTIGPKKSGLNTTENLGKLRSCRLHVLRAGSAQVGIVF